MGYKGDSSDTPDFSVRYQGLFDFDAVYAAIIDWAKNYGYIWHEQTYKHKVPSPSGAEQEWLWFLEKEVNEYIHYKIKIKAKTYDMSEVEVQTETGAKKTISSGKIKMTIIGTTKVDWQKKFAHSGKIGQWMGKIYEKMYFKEITGGYGDTLHYRVANLQAIIKKVLDMQTKYFSHKGYLKEHF